MRGVLPEMRPPSFPDELAFWNMTIPIDRSDIFQPSTGVGVANKVDGVLRDVMFSKACQTFSHAKSRVWVRGWLGYTIAHGIHDA